MNLNCKECEHWTRWKKHDELAEQHVWGDCKELLDSPNLVDIYANNRDGEWIETKAVVNENFGCKLFSKRGKEEA